MNVFSRVTDILPDIDENDEEIVDELIKKKKVEKKERKLNNKSHVEIYLEELRMRRSHNSELLDVVLKFYQLIFDKFQFSPSISTIETSVCLRYDTVYYTWRHFELVINPNYSVTWIWFSHQQWLDEPISSGKFTIEENEELNAIILPEDIMDKFKFLRETSDQEFATSLSMLKKK
jgi:hypothetical protein